MFSPVLLPIVYLSFRNRHIQDKIRFFMTGTACCIGVRVFSSFLANPVIKYLSGVDPSQQPGVPIPALYSLAVTVVPVLIMSFLLWGVESTSRLACVSPGRLTRSDCVSYGIAFVSGIILWIASPTLFGTAQAYDSHYYPPALFLIGLVSGLLRPGFVRRPVLAVVIGQILGFLFRAVQGMGPLWLMGLFFILANSFVIVVGVMVGSLLRGKRVRPERPQILSA